MNNRISFIKMHGLGNDFVFIKEELLENIQDIKNFIINISDRRIGIGCDQFITYKKLSNNNVLMHIFNQDGSMAKVCGNASRCLARLMFDEYGFENISIKIYDRIIDATYINQEDITVNMGKTSFSAAWMPRKEDLWELAEKYRIEPKELLCVDVANPHIVIFTKLSDVDKAIIGDNLQKHELFPDGINVNFAEIKDDVINLKVWERGTGFTLACGSGACASFAVASKFGFVGDRATVIFELGSLKMIQKNNQIFMQGSASYVFSGEYLL